MLLGRAQQRWDADDRWTGAGYLGLATGLEVLTTFGTMWSLNKVIRGAELAAAPALPASNQSLVIAPFYLQLAQQGATVAGQVVESVKTGDRSRIKTADWMSLASSTAGLLAASGALRGVSTMSSNLRYNRAVKRGDISGETRPIFHDVGRTVWEGVATEAKRLTTISTGSLVGAGLGGEPLAVMVTGGALTYAASAQLAQQRALSEASGRLNILARGPSAEGYNPAGAWLHEHFRVPSIDQIRQGGEDVTLTARVPRLARWLGVTPGTIGVRADVLQKLHYDSVISSPEDAAIILQSAPAPPATPAPPPPTTQTPPVTSQPPRPIQPFSLSRGRSMTLTEPEAPLVQGIAQLKIAEHEMRAGRLGTQHLVMLRVGAQLALPGGVMIGGEKAPETLRDWVRGELGRRINSDSSARADALNGPAPSVTLGDVRISVAPDLRRAG